MTRLSFPVALAGLAGLTGLLALASPAHALASPAHAVPPPPPLAGASPLVGAILDARTGAALGPEDVAARIAAADLVLLGERHDNPDHHALQAWAVGVAAAAEPDGRLVLEMVRAGEGAPLAEADPARLDALGAALDWEARGWPDFALYAPILEAALEAGWTLQGGDAAAPAMGAVARGGEGALDPAEAARLGLDAPLPAALSERVTRAVVEGHCGLLPDEMVPGMAAAQRLRDAALADAMLAGDGPAVLIAGAGHVGDEAAPWYLARRAPERDVLAVAFAEAPPAADDPAEIVESFGTPEAGVDIVWFTGSVERGDVCAELEARFGGG